jgi:hypothetical protein
MRQEAETRWLFLAMLIIGDESGDGVVDMPIDRLAARAALPEETVRASLLALMSPDPNSHSKKYEGRRIVPLNEAEERGWMIVNWVRYRKMASKEARRSQMRSNSAAYRSRIKELEKLEQKDRRHHPSSPVSPPYPNVSEATPSPDPSPAPTTPPLPGMERGSRVRAPAKPFIPPTIQDVEAFCDLKGYTNVDPIDFVAHYETNGWMVGKTRMKKWKWAVLRWERNKNG